jgi:cytochrome c-type biogenesis protein CcmH
MTLFIVIMIIMVLFAIAIFVVPYWKTTTTIATNNINIELFKSNESYLNQRYQMGELSENDYKQALTELQLTLLDDANGSRSSESTKKTDIGLIIASMVFVLIMSPLIYFSLGNQQWLEYENTDTEQLQSFLMLVNKLERKLEQKPDDIEGWLLLSRSYIKFKEYDKAANAYAHLYQLVGDEPTLLVDYADVLVMVGTTKALTLAEILLNKALAQTPNNRDGLWVMGNVKFKQHDYDQSLEFLTKAKQQFIADNEPHDGLIKQIARVKNKQ